MWDALFALKEELKRESEQPNVTQLNNNQNGQQNLHEMDCIQECPPPKYEV